MLGFAMLNPTYIAGSGSGGIYPISSGNIRIEPKLKNK